MRNEKDYFNHYNEFERNLDFEILFQKIDGALLLFVIFYNNVYFYLIDFDKFFCWFI